MVEVGEGAERYKKGDRVFVSHHVPCNTCHYCLNGNHTACDTLHTTNFDPGGFAEYIRVPEINIDRGVFVLPDEMSFEDGSFIEPLACAGFAVGYAIACSNSANRQPGIGTRLMDSEPPAMMTSAKPAMMRSAAIAMDWRPEEQKRLIVIPGTDWGRPARRLTIRAMLWPCSASGNAQPRITSSISSAASPGVCRSKAAMTVAAMSSGRVCRNVPRGAFPIAVRRLATMTASLISASFNQQIVRSDK